MKNITAFILFMCFVNNSNGQLLKKLKGQFEDKFKEKRSQKKDQKIDEKADKAATQVVNMPDSVITRESGKVRNREDVKKDSLKAKMSVTQ